MRPCQYFDRVLLGLMLTLLRLSTTRGAEPGGGRRIKPERQRCGNLRGVAIRHETLPKPCSAGECPAGPERGGFDRHRRRRRWQAALPAKRCHY